MNGKSVINFFRYFFVLTGVFLSTQTYAQDAQCLYERHKSATVEIEYKYETEQDGEGRSNGTGFIVSSDGDIVTNAHVVSLADESIKIKNSSINVRVGGLMSTPILATVQEKNISRSEDLALIKLSLSTPITWPALPISYIDKLPVGSSLTGLGFPGGSDISIVPSAQKTADSTVVDNQSKAWWQTNLALTKGNSGGPIFGKLGTVVGIAVAINRNAAYRTYVIPIARAQPLLEEAGVKPVTFGPCADFPVCRHQSHGLERYAVNEPVSDESPWEPGGGNPRANQNYWCSKYLEKLQVDYPASSFVKTSSTERKEFDFGNTNVRYKYTCVYRRLEGPIFNETKSASCLK